MFILRPAILFAMLALAVPSLPAGTASFSGNFNQDDDIQLFQLRLDAPGTITAQTLSFAQGGFSPVLSLFDGSGTELLQALDFAGVPHSDCGPRATDSSSGLCWDAFLSVALNAGSYTLALTEDDNTPFGPTFADGFLRAGEGNFTGPNFRGQPGSFILITGQQRSNAWALDITADAVTQVPEPATGLLIVAGLAIFFACSAAYAARRGSLRDKGTPGRHQV